jgi:hypothetical protein
VLLCVVLFSFNDSVINYHFLSVFIPFRLGYLIAWPEAQMELVFSSRLTKGGGTFSGSQPGIGHLACQGRNLIALDEEISARRGRKGGA